MRTKPVGQYLGHDIKLKSSEEDRQRKGVDREVLAMNSMSKGREVVKAENSASWILCQYFGIH